MKANIERLSIPHGTKIYATSDIHGHLEMLEKLICKSDRCEDDPLFIVGDIVEKGPQVLASLRYAMKLADTPNVYISAGNVDVRCAEQIYSITPENARDMLGYILFMRARHAWGTCLFEEMAAELGIPISTPEEVYSASLEIRKNFASELDFLLSRPTAYDCGDVIFVHGGLPTTDHSRLHEYDRNTLLKFDAFMESGMSFDKYVVCGHWPVTLYNKKHSQQAPILNPEQRIISLDGGMGLKLDGQLNLATFRLDRDSLDRGEFSHIHADALPVVTALDAQDESRDSINIIYTDNKIDLLCRGEEFSLVRHISTGYEYMIPTVMVFPAGDHFVCEDFTDYNVPVNEGDALSLVLETSRGYMIKKDGVSGWYRGRISKSNNILSKQHK